MKDLSKGISVQGEAEALNVPMGQTLKDSGVD